LYRSEASIILDALSCAIPGDDPGSEFPVFDDEMLTIEELAAYLKLKPQTIYKWAQAGKVPGAKFGKEWRFRRSSIEKWIDSRIAESPPGSSGASSDEKSAAAKKSRRSSDRSPRGPSKN